MSDPKPIRFGIDLPPSGSKVTRSVPNIGVLPQAADHPLQPADQVQLDALAAIIEACRERLRPEFGKTWRGLRPNRDHVDTMEWDELLLFASPAVLKLCMNSATKPAELVKLAGERWPLTNTRALAWISFFFSYAERFNIVEETTGLIALRDMVVAREADRAQAARVARAKAAVNARHDQKGGSRDRARAVRDLWANGKYASRDDLAHAIEAEGKGMSFDAARKALKKTPDLEPWPAKTDGSRRTRR